MAMVMVMVMVMVMAAMASVAMLVLNLQQYESSTLKTKQHEEQCHDQSSPRSIE